MQNLADELQGVVMRAAGPVHAGMSIKSQQNRACDNLGYPRGYWRVRTAWYGYAGNWNSKAVFDLLDRYNRFLRKQQSQHVVQDNVAAEELMRFCR